MKDIFIKCIDKDRNFDIFNKKIIVKKIQGEVFFLTSLVDSLILLQSLKSLEELLEKDNIIENSSSPQIKMSEDINQILTSFYEGCAIVFLEKVYLIDCRKYPQRGIDEPYTEKSIRGSRDGFNEQINTNIGLIRLRIKSKFLASEIYSLSKYGNTYVSLVYLKDKVDNKIIEELRTRISKLNISSLIMSDRSLVEKLLNKKNMLFPIVRYTERVDIACINIINGKIILLVDSSPSVIILPITLFDHFKHVEEYRQPPLIGSFTKIIRIFSIGLSIFLSPIILCLYIDHDVINYFSLTSDKLPNVISFEMITATIVLEIFRIATIHTPSPLVGAIGLVSALVLGQVSIELGIFSSEVLLVVCISSICGYATSSYELSLSNKFVNIALLVVSAVFKIEGFLIAITILFLYLVSIKNFNKYYLEPLIPFDLRKLSRYLFRHHYGDEENL